MSGCMEQLATNAFASSSKVFITLTFYLQYNATDNKLSYPIILQTVLIFLQVGMVWLSIF